MAKPSVLIVVGQVLGEPWLDIATRGQLRTWVPEAESHGLRVRHSYGRPPGGVLRRVDALHEWARWTHWGRLWVPRLDAAWGSLLMNWRQDVSVDEFDGPDHVGWRQGLPDVYMFQRWKVLGSLGQSLQEDYDFVYFTTASSYVRPNALVEFASSLPRSRCYAGTKMVDHGTGLVFGSGANRFLSRDVVEMVLSHRDWYRNDVMEDVGLGRVVKNLGMDLIPAPSMNVGSLTELESLGDVAIEEHFHFRLKSGTSQQRNDVELMHALHERLSAGNLRHE